MNAEYIYTRMCICCLCANTCIYPHTHTSAVLNYISREVVLVSFPEIPSAQRFPLLFPLPNNSQWLSHTTLLPHSHICATLRKSQLRKKKHISWTASSSMHAGWLGEQLSLILNTTVYCIGRREDQSLCLG